MREDFSKFYFMPKIWKTQQWPQDWKGQLSFQSQRKAMPKYIQPTAQLQSFWSHFLTITYQHKLSVVGLILLNEQKRSRIFCPEKEV